MSYAPFRGAQNPLTPDLMIDPAQIAADFAQLATFTSCVRIYSLGLGMDRVPELAAKAGLEVLLGIWIGREPLKNAKEIEGAIALAAAHPDVVKAIIVGSEVMLRADMTAPELRALIHSVKTRTRVPVSYADVWEFWLRHRELGDVVDFVTIHVLPYWEDFPVRARHAAAHMDDIRKRVGVAFPGKEVVIGEIGWPSAGRMRSGALPSRVNQARVLSEVQELARQEGFRINLIEAFDQPWKREWEGAAGGHWGLLTSAQRASKYPPGVAVTNVPYWKLQLGAGLAFCIVIFGTALLVRRRAQSKPMPSAWYAVALSAMSGGVLTGLIAEHALRESFGVAGVALNTMMLVLSLGLPLLASGALMTGEALPTTLDLVGPRDVRSRLWSVRALGFLMLLTALVAIETALGLVFDPRYRDLPFAGVLGMAIPLLLLRLLNRRGAGDRPVAEMVYAGVLASAAVYVGFNEGPANWQALLTCAGLLLLAIAFARARTGQKAVT